MGKRRKEITFFNKGLFNRSFMDTRIKTTSMSLKEKLLGYLIGPFGVMALMAVVNQLAELYYTEVFYVDRIFGVGTYLVMMWTTRILAAVSGVLAAFVVEHTVCRQGKFRPLLLIGALITAVSAFCMFWIPDFPDEVKLIWVYIFNILYNAVGLVLVNLKVNLITLCTRNQNDRNQVNLLGNISSFLLVGTGVTLVVGSLLYYTMLHGYPAKNWIMLVGGFALLTVPLSIIQYYYTKERVTMENVSAGEENPSGKGHIRKQLKCLFSSRYWVLAFLFGMIQTISSNISGYNLNTNFCTVILGATIENNYNLIYTIASGVPLGLGILFIYPLCKKYTIRKVTMVFSLITIGGNILGLLAGNHFWPVVLSNFICNMGILPLTYVIGSLTASANDDVEYKFRFRPEGTVAAALVGILTTVISGCFAGVYETGLSATGYEADLGVAQPSAVITWIYIIKYVAPIIANILYFVILYFLDLEKHLPAMQREIQMRHQAEAEAKEEEREKGGTSHAKYTGENVE